MTYCESSNVVHQRSNPNYRGIFQVGYAEWREYGGVALTGYTDPADASEAEQDEIAHRLYLARGWSPWDCARSLGYA